MDDLQFILDEDSDGFSVEIYRPDGDYLGRLDLFSEVLHRDGTYGLPFPRFHMTPEAIQTWATRVLNGEVFA